MHANNDLMNVRAVCLYFQISESTVRRLVRNSREGIGGFPLPLFPSKHKLLWKREHIEAWAGVEAETVVFSPPFSQGRSTAVRAREAAKDRKELQALNVKLAPLQAIGEANG